MGVFCCFVVAGGVIVKYNLNSDGKVLFDNCLGADVQNPVMRGKQLETEERKSKSRLNSSGNTNRPDTEREFFQAHRSEIEFISKVGTSMLLCVKWVGLRCLSTAGAGREGQGQSHLRRCVRRPCLTMAMLLIASARSAACLSESMHS